MRSMPFKFGSLHGSIKVARGYCIWNYLESPDMVCFQVKVYCLHCQCQTYITVKLKLKLRVLCWNEGKIIKNATAWFQWNLNLLPPTFPSFLCLTMTQMSQSNIWGDEVCHSSFVDFITSLLPRCRYSATLFNCWWGVTLATFTVSTYEASVLQFK